MRIGLKVSLWKRHDVFRIFAAGAQRLHNKYGVEVFIVGSEGNVSKALCEEYGFHYIECINNPMGAKLNAALAEMRHHNLDYIINLGSDDLIDNKLMEVYLKFMGEGWDVIGLLDTYYYDLLSKRLLYSYGYAKTKRNGEPIGLGRAISRQVLDSCNWKLWSDRQHLGALDKSVTDKVSKFNKKRLITLTSYNCFAVDLKSSESLHTYPVIKRIIKKYKEVDINLIRQHFPEWEMILNYRPPR